MAEIKAAIEEAQAAGVSSQEVDKAFEVLAESETDLKRKEDAEQRRAAAAERRPQVSKKMAARRAPMGVDMGMYMANPRGVEIELK